MLTGEGEGGGGEGGGGGEVPGLHRYGWVSCTCSDSQVIISVQADTPHTCHGMYSSLLLAD